MLAAGEPFDTVQQVAGLATDLQAGVASVPFANVPTSPTSRSVAGLITGSPTLPGSPVGTQQFTQEATASPTLELTATPAIFDTPTPRPTHTPVPTAGAPYQLVSQDQVCNANLTDGLMQISVLDSHRHQVPGVEIFITWSGGEEQFFTGLKPEIANGYADYVMQAGVAYTVRAGLQGTPVSNLTAPACPDSSGQTFTGGLKLVFQQP
jgi:hypothetical protein